MAQYSKKRRSKLNPQPNGDLYEVFMQADENGELWNLRYNKDAWGRPKVIHDYSIFSATWTFNVPERVWEEVSWDYTNQVPTLQPALTSKVTSKNHMLSVLSGTSAGNGTVARSRKYMRYQPNRGQLFSTAITVPEPTAQAVYTWGLSTAHNGVEFKLVGDGSDWDMRVTRRRDSILTEETSITKAILTRMPGFDPSKGNVYDIQYEWRGVGNFYFFVNLELVYTMSILGTLDALSVNDPALPAVFNSTTLLEGNEVELLAGCVDVTSEGGAPDRTLFGSVNTGTSLVTLGASTVDTAVLALRAPRMIGYDSDTVFNSRGAFMDKLITWTRDESLTQVFIGREVSATTLANQNWDSINDTSLQYLVGGDGTNLDSAFGVDLTAGVMSPVLGEWADLDVKNVITNDAKNADFQLVPGDILVITVRSIGASNVKSSATLYYSEEL